MSIASDLTALCSDQTALVNDILAQSGIIMDIPASDMSVVTGGSGSITVQLVAGGDATLSIPAGVSVDGIPFRMIVAGNVTFSSTNPNLTGSVSPNLAAANSQAGVGSGAGIATTIPFYIETTYLWSSASSTLLMVCDKSFSKINSVASQGGNLPQITSIGSQSGLSFTLTAGVTGSGVTSSDTLSITTFRLVQA